MERKIALVDCSRGWKKSDGDKLTKTIMGIPFTIKKIYCNWSLGVCSYNSFSTSKLTAAKKTLFSVLKKVQDEVFPENYTPLVKKEDFSKTEIFTMMNDEKDREFMAEYAKSACYHIQDYSEKEIELLNNDRNKIAKMLYIIASYLNY